MKTKEITKTLRNGYTVEEMYELYKENKQEFKEELEYDLKAISYEKYCEFDNFDEIVEMLCDEDESDEEKTFAFISHLEELTKEEIEDRYSEIVIYW